MSWSSEDRKTVIDLFNSGARTGAIWRRFPHVTRNAIIGIIARARKDGLITREKQKRGEYDPQAHVPRAGGRPKGSVSVKKIEPVEPILAISELLERDPIPDNAVTVADLSATVCRWPIGDPAQEDFRFCGRKAGLNPRTGRPSPYCQGHDRMAFQPAMSRRERDRDLVRKRLNFG